MTTVWICYSNCKMHLCYCFTQYFFLLQQHLYYFTVLIICDFNVFTDKRKSFLLSSELTGLMDTLHTSVCGSDPVSDLFTFRVWRKAFSVFVCSCATCLCRSCSQMETWFWMLCYFCGKSWRCSCRMSKWILQSLHRSIIPNRYLFKEYCWKCQLSLCMLSNTA